MSSEKNPINSTNPYELTNTNAFESFNSVATSFYGGLENSILELAKNSNKLLMSDVLQRFGNYPQVHNQVKRLLLENKLVMYELEDDSIFSDKFNFQELRLVNPGISKWFDLSAQPCLTCSIFNECAIENPVSPSSCDEFEVWLSEEIHLEYKI